MKKKYLFLLIYLLGACSCKKQKLSEYINLDEVSTEDRIIVCSNKKKKNVIIDSVFIHKLKNAVRTHNSYKYANYCSINLRNKRTNEVYSINLIDTVLVKFDGMHFILK